MSNRNINQHAISVQILSCTNFPYRSLKMTENIQINYVLFEIIIAEALISIKVVEMGSRIAYNSFLCALQG